MNLIKKITLLFSFLISFIAIAQEDAQKEKKKLKVEGTIDVYFRTNIDAPNDENAIAPNSAFANLNGFALGMANVIASYGDEKTGFVANLAFGPRADDAIFNAPDDSSSKVINELYAYWNVTERIKLTIGNFNTFLGYEVISPTGNFNYSTSYLFSYGPFSHTGIKADFDLSNDWTLALAVMNPTDITEFNPNSDYTLGTQIGFKKQYINIVYGKQVGATEPLFQIDYTGGFDINKKLFLGLNASYQDTDGVGFSGIAIYPNYKVSKSFGLGLRAEYFKENGSYGAIGTTVADSSVFATTLTGSYTVGDLTLKPELRLDSASENAFVNVDLDPSKTLSSFVFAAIYSF